MLNRELQNGQDLAVQFFGARFGEAAGAGFGMNAGGEERFIGVDVANAADEGLVE